MEQKDKTVHISTFKVLSPFPNNFIVTVLITDKEGKPVGMLQSDLMTEEQAQLMAAKWFWEAMP